jgi:hypothetical protein
VAQSGKATMKYLIADEKDLNTIRRRRKQAVATGGVNLLVHSFYETSTGSPVKDSIALAMSGSTCSGSTCSRDIVLFVALFSLVVEATLGSTHTLEQEDVQQSNFTVQELHRISGGTSVIEPKINTLVAVTLSAGTSSGVVSSRRTQSRPPHISTVPSI